MTQDGIGRHDDTRRDASFKIMDSSRKTHLAKASTTRLASLVQPILEICMYMDTRTHLKKIFLSKTVYGLFFTALGLCYLYAYTRIIGRPDIFVTALNDSAIVIYVLAFLAVMGVVALTIFALPSYFLIFACDRTAIEARMSDRYDTRACITAISGICTFLAIFIISVFIDVQTGTSVTASQILLALLISMIILYVLIMRKEIKVKINSRHYRKFPGFIKIAFVHFQILFFLFASSILSFFVVDLVFKFNNWEENWHDYALIAAYCFICMTTTLLPGVFYLLARPCRNSENHSNIKNKIIALFIGWIVFTAILMACTGNLLGVAALNLGKGLGMTDETARYYNVPAVYRYSLTPERWGKYEANGNTLQLKGKLLFNFGNIRLLCPADIDLTWSSMDQIRKTSDQCISFHRDDITKLHAAAEKSDGANPE
ncbi:hypothetical protein M1D97_08785 [Kushneria sp. AK178]